MGQIREIKCPHCGEWTLWDGRIDDRCFNCDGFLEPRRFSREVEKKIRSEVIKENDYFFVKPSDGPFKRNLKSLLNAFRWIAFYLQIVFFVFISFVLVLISLIAG